MIMAFAINVDEFQALLDVCSSTRDREMLTECILIPDEWIPMVYARLSELTTQETPVSNLFLLSSSLIFFCCCFSFHDTINTSEMAVKRLTKLNYSCRLKSIRIINEADELDNFVSIFCLKL